LATDCHEPDEDNAVAADSPMLMRLIVQAELDDLPGTLLNLRALRAFSHAAARYPVHRIVRCAARGDMVELFDDLALNSGYAAQRLTLGSLLLDGPGVFVALQGQLKARYTSCRFTVWADTPKRAVTLEEQLLAIVGERRMQEETFTMEWRFSEGQGYTTGASFEELADPALLDEAYPTLGEPVARFIERYLAADETVLILQGPPGTGKTRLVRAILAAISRRKGSSAKVLYTADREALESDRIFLQFITGEHDAFVIEDADHILASRANGNESIHRFLAIADGVVRAQGRKILFTTNLPNVHDIDEALLRPGRCFANVRTQALNRVETANLLRRLSTAAAEVPAALIGRMTQSDATSMTLAEIYQHLPRARGGGMPQ
jgi:hypothetical protein